MDAITNAKSREMARGLLISSQSRTTSNHLFFNTISRVSPSKYRSLFIPNYLPTPLCTSPLHLYCKCSNLHDKLNSSKYRDIFSRRMAMAGLKPCHRIAIGVSGGPDSMALCALAAGWKVDAFNAAAGYSVGFIEGLLAIIVDHGLRPESKDEADLVFRRVSDMGIRCEVARCDWSDGRPKQGHLQEAARDMRYQIFQNVCIKHQISVLLIAHHADDQAELFVLRLSRNSGVLGLAGMAFISQLFSSLAHSDGEALDGHGILLVRPLLEFSKEDMYKICQGANLEWVEDPSNQSQLFARNRIRMSLRNLSPCFKSELQALISACRKTRSYVDRICCNLINQAVTVMAQGYAVIDVEVLNPSKIEDICLSKFVALVLQFISQRHRPVRGSASKLLLDYIRTSPCKTSLTAAGCYLCAAPGSKGTRLLVCCCVNSPPPSKMKLLPWNPCEGEKHEIPSKVEYGKLYSDNLIPDGSDVHFLDVTSCESVLTDARRLNLLTESTIRSIHMLQTEETKHFKSQTEKKSDCEVKHEAGSGTTSTSGRLQPGQIGHFMNRFLVTWNLHEKSAGDILAVEADNCEWDMGGNCHHHCCRSCVVGHNMVAEVRHMVDADWLYLTKLSKSENIEQFQQQRNLLSHKEQEAEKTDFCSDYVRLSAQRALLSLKSVPVAARRGLPVLVNPQGLLLSIPSISFQHCPCLMATAVFKPRVPLGGGHNSFM